MEESEKKIILLESDVIKLLEVAKKNRTSKIGELLGMKYLDKLLPRIKGEPDWGYDELEKFFTEHGIENSETIDEALTKLNKR